MMLRTPLIFLLGLGVGLAVRTGAAQDRRLPGNNGINHLAFATPKYAEMLQFYTQTLGFSEAFSNKNADGQPTLTYLQASRNTFIELMPAGGQPAGGVHPLRRPRGRRAGGGRTAAGARAAGRDAPHIGSGSLTVAITDPDGNRLELSELPPDAPARKAMDAWK